MADQEQVSKLKEGVKAWNEWRQAHPGIRPALSGADFSGTDFFSLATPNDATFTGADLSKADFTGANLRQATFSGATLNYVSFHGADLSGASLFKADLSSADLTGAFFDTRTTLNNAAFSDGVAKSASVADVSWGGVNLAVVDWEPVKLLGDEYQARSSKDQSDYQTAVRANRQLTVVLRDQGLNEEADYFAYRA